MKLEFDFIFYENYFRGRRVGDLNVIGKYRNFFRIAFE